MTAALAPVPPRDRGLWLASIVIALTVHAAGLALALRLTPSAPPPPVETRVSVEEIRMATSTPRAAPAILSAEPAADAPVAVAPAASPAASSPARPAALTPAEVVTAEAALPAASADLPALAATSAAAPVTVATTSAPRVLPAATALPTTASALPQLSATDAPDPIAAAPAERSAAPAPVDALTATATPRLSAQAAVDPAFAAEASARTLPGAVTPATPADGALRIAGQPVTGQPAEYSAADEVCYQLSAVPSAPVYVIPWVYLCRRRFRGVTNSAQQTKPTPILLSHLANISPKMIVLSKRWPAPQRVFERLIVLLCPLLIQPFQELNHFQIIINEAAIGQFQPILLCFSRKISKLTLVHRLPHKGLGLVKEALVVPDKIENHKPLFTIALTQTSADLLKK